MIYFVRHGKTDYNEKNLLSGGDLDISINEEGKKQAKITAKLLKNVKFDVIFCSPLIRAKETCKEILKFHKNVQVYFDERIVELKLGKLNGEFAQGYDELLWKIDEKPKMKVKETLSEFYDRCASFLNEVREKYRDKNVLVVAHNGVGAMFKWYFYGEPKDKDLTNYFSDNCEIVKFKFN